MANRVVLGNIGGTYGLFVSKPGVDVLSATAAEMMFDSGAASNLTIVAIGTISFVSGGTNTIDVTIPTQANAPLVQIKSDSTISSTVFRTEFYSDGYTTSCTTTTLTVVRPAARNGTNRTFTYLVFNQRAA